MNPARAVAIGAFKHLAPLRQAYFSLAERQHRSRLARAAEESAGREREVYLSLLERGWHVMPNFWSAADALTVRQRLESSCGAAGAQSEHHPYLGSNRYYHVERDVPELGTNFKEHPFLLAVARGFNGHIPAGRRTMYQHTVYDPAVAQHYERDIGLSSGPTPISPRFHFDFMRHTLKAALYLSDVRLENGPTEFCLLPDDERGHRVRASRKAKQVAYLRKYFDRRVGAEDTIWTHYEARALELASFAQPLVGQAGTLVIFDTFTVHRAAEPRAGERHVLWYYFDP